MLPLDIVNVVLEVLQTKRNVPRMQQLVTPLFDLLEHLIDPASPCAVEVRYPLSHPSVYSSIHLSPSIHIQIFYSY